MLARNRAIVQILCVGRTWRDRPLHLWMCNPVAGQILCNYLEISRIHDSETPHEGNSFPYAPPDYP